MQSDFASRLQPFLQAAKSAGIDLKIGSGYRSVERQKELWAAALKKYGSPAAARKWVAPPGKSNHNGGRAADLWVNGKAISRNSKAGKWAHENAAKYGLYFRMGHEPWHIEPTKGGAPKTASLANEATKVASMQPDSESSRSVASAPSGSSGQMASAGTHQGHSMGGGLSTAISSIFSGGSQSSSGVSMASMDPTAQKKANDISDLSRKTAMNREGVGKRGPVTQNIAMTTNEKSDTTGTGFPSKDNPMVAMNDTHEKFTAMLFGIA